MMIVFGQLFLLLVIAVLSAAVLYVVEEILKAVKELDYRVWAKACKVEEDANKKKQDTDANDAPENVEEVKSKRIYRRRTKLSYKMIALQLVASRKNGIKKRTVIEEILKAGSVAPYQVMTDLINSKCVRSVKKKYFYLKGL